MAGFKVYPKYNKKKYFLLYSIIMTKAKSDSKRNHFKLLQQVLPVQQVQQVLPVQPVQPVQPVLKWFPVNQENGRYIFKVDDNNSLAGRINNFYVNHGFTPLDKNIVRAINPNPPLLNEIISDKLIDSITQEDKENGFCSPKGEGVGADYIYQEFIKQKESVNWTILINTILYCDAEGNPFAFLMYRNYPDVPNAVYISILCVNALVPKDHYPKIYGDLIVNNFKVACESVGGLKIYLESLDTAEPFWISKKFSLVVPNQKLSANKDRLFYHKIPLINTKTVFAKRNPNNNKNKKGGTRKRNKKTKTKTKKRMNKTRKK
jgi:hypothetical protein